jgi:hypothetical protein
MNKIPNINIYKPNKCVRSSADSSSSGKAKGEDGNPKDQVDF